MELQRDKPTLLDTAEVPATVVESSEYESSLQFLSIDKQRLFDALWALPKIDLHRHLEGSFTPEMMIPLAKEYGVRLPAEDVESLRPFVQVTPEDKSLVDFLTKFPVIGALFVNPEVVERLTFHSVMEAARENIAYLELRCSPYYIAQSHGLDVKDVI